MSAMLFSLPGCNNESEQSDANKTTINTMYQFEKPKENEEIAIIETSEGTFKVRFFPEDAPKAVENFKSLSKNGYYNGVTFHRVIENFMIQGGDPQGTGMGGESTWGKDFEDEFSERLFNVTGSLAMANRGPNTNGSQFFINNQDPSKFKGWDMFEQYYNIYKQNPDAFNQNYGGTIDMSKITDEIKTLYKNHGGNPNLDGYYNTAKKGHTVFGQVFEGMDVVDKISKCKTDANDKPITSITIKNIEFEKYSNE